MIDPEKLNDVEFDSVFEILDNGAVVRRPDLFAPTLYESELDSSDWRLWSYGYSGQWNYAGPILHNSEYLGGGMLRDLLAEPGIYVMLVCLWNSEEDGIDVEGWAIAKLKESDR